MEKIDPKSIEGYICFKLLSMADKQIIKIPIDTIKSETLKIIPIEYNKEVIYLAAGNLGIHWIRISAPGYEERNFALVIQNLNIYLNSIGEKQDSMKQAM